ncbi:MAG TPA: hypothetical protein VMH77_02680 [Steroidobacteraceae bacterium]|nr:hypothetical protein [Steroidobacteraceae bacterium]
MPAIIIRAALGACIALCAASAGFVATAPACDRACLDGFMDRFLDSMKAHDPALLPMTQDVKFTENTIALKPGQGLWVSLSDVTPYTFHLADPRTGQAGFLGRVLEYGKPLYVAARLKVRDGKVSEIEMIAERDAPFGNNDITVPRPDFATPLAPSERVPRAQMIAAALSYFDSIEQHDGKVAPFAADCERYEDGVRTAGPPLPRPAAAPPAGTRPASAAGSANLGALGCAAQMNTGIFIAKLTPRRVWLVDEERGVVMGAFFFSHDGRTTEIKLGNGTVHKVGDPAPASYPAGEMFRIRNGQISRVEAVYGMKLPFGIQTGWE